MSHSNPLVSNHESRSTPARSRQRGIALTPSPRHAGLVVALHWGSAVAVVVCALAALLRLYSENDELRAVYLDVHRQSGLLVLFAWALRLLARWRLGLADHAGAQPKLMRVAAQMAHLALYALLLVLPLLGIATTQAHEVTVRVLGLWALPQWVAADPDLADRLSDYHLWASWVLLAMVVLHIAAALWHHWVRRDGVLAAMLPALQNKAPR